MEFNINQIMELIPHRYPFLLIDKVVDVVPGESAKGIKNVTINEPFFPGHFPQKPVMPGVLILEAMAQTAAVIAVDFLGEDAQGRVVYFMGIDGAKFRKPVEPGDRLEMKLTKTRGGGAVWKFDAEATVDGTMVCQAKLTAMLGAKED
ncbi:3-hydroxyacyl-ACP dehydratase FabZ [Kordiimonas sp. SCSIO 12610]|uniref:3-hydroxyacyl-ACP dehydratase FabZ n=1 Tax=Kordiimonas sp. SCSIO 12610 TaxID=2829597 RepID=UPI00210B0B07|nr:3-hydroxyacyl-ACP dehydratase FabZ [Kordiimonas sp. SCSIO 12610]UTW54046.1 3-hydroxyacyl-ACP dehydratase FabZ [Kordiimonas sp. SCSIO 12610]